jgi:hypothetical protein
MSIVTTSPSVLVRAARGSDGIERGFDDSVVIRVARESDGAALEQLARLDSAVVPAGDVLVAEADGEIVAALAPASGERIADPFRRTAALLELLAVRAGSRRAAERRGLAERLGLRPAPHAGTA